MPLRSCFAVGLPKFLSPGERTFLSASTGRGTAPHARPALILLILSALLAPDPCFCTTPIAAPALKEAVRRAQPGDTLLVSGSEGVYPGKLWLNKPIRIIGTNNAVISGTGTGSVILVTAPRAEIHNIEIRNSGADLTTLDSAILVEADGVTVANCSVFSPAFGIYLRAANHCRIVSNTISGDPALAPSKRGNGVHLWKTRTNVVAFNRIFDKRDGLYLSFADHTEIRGNDVRNTRFGIHYMYSHYNRLIGNMLTANAVGATLMFSQQSLIEGNTAFANRRHGMVFKQLDNSVIRANRIVGQNRGFFVQQATANRFEANVVATNDIGVYLSNGSEQNVFVGNVFQHNVDQVWQPPYEAEQGRRGPNQFFENRRGNFWSDYTGADRNGDGVGDTPYHETDVFGYLVERYPDARVFTMSPAVSALRRAEQLMPVLDTVGVVDLFPLMSASPVHRAALNAHLSRVH